MAKWVALLSALASLLQCFLNWSRNRSDAQAEEAIVTGDEDAVNDDFARLLKCILFLVGLWLVAPGCTPAPIVTPDRRMHRVTHENVDGWFVPDAQMLEIRRALNR